MSKHRKLAILEIRPDRWRAEWTYTDENGTDVVWHGVDVYDSLSEAIEASVDRRPLTHLKVNG